MAYFVFGFVRQIEARLLLDGLKDGQTPEGCFKRNDVFAVLHFGRAVVHRAANGF